METDSTFTRPNLVVSSRLARLPQQPLREVWDDLSMDMKLSIIQLVVYRFRVKPHPVATRWKQRRFDWKKGEVDRRGGVVPQAAL